uniref:Sugar transporter-like protein homeolog p n=1 Tax=Epichloe coenophiala TaxID=5047 RepID=A0A346R946_EPICN|nr:sugar transporter-like protein homeolog p [Epichloe coenophiala]
MHEARLWLNGNRKEVGTLRQRLQDDDADAVSKQAFEHRQRVIVMVRKYLGLSGQSLNWAIGAVAGCDFLLFGYDQGVMGGILTLPVFLDQFPDINDTAPDLDPATKSNRATYQGIAVASYNLGCFLGAIATIFIGNPLGRRRIIFLGTAVMTVGAALQASAFSLQHFIIGRIITGFGNGGNTSTVPMWQSETCSAHKRGKLVMIEGALITGGIMISYWVDLGLSFAPGSVAWRFPLAFQIVFCVFILSLVLSLPESPRWLILKSRDEEAREVIAAIAEVEDDDNYVDNEVRAIKETVAEMSRGRCSDLFARDQNRTLHRTLIAYVNQMFQQISGINLITYYAATIYRGLGMSPFMSRLLAALNGTEYFIASWPSVFLVERVGRRKLMLFGGIGQALTMAILAGVGSNTESTGCQIAGIVFLFVFNTFFAVGWLGMTWLYPAEITPLRTRAPANALSTSSNWIFNFMVVMITPVAFANIKHHTYTIFAIINAIMVPSVYFFFPETAYRTLEEMDSIFQKVHGWKGAFQVVHQARVEPRRYGKNGELLITLNGVKEKGNSEHTP